MRALWSLVRVNFLIFIGALQKKKKGRYVGAAFMILFFLVFFGGSMSIQAVATAYQLVMVYQLPRYAIFMGLTSALAISMLFGLMRATTAPTSKDADLLLSMPLRKSTVVLSKIMTQYLFDAPLLIIMLLPTMIATFSFGGLTVFGLLRGILLVILIPVLSLTISMLFGYLFSFIRERVPGGSLILIGVTMVILMGYIILNMQMNTVFLKAAEMGSERTTLIIEKVLPIKHVTYFVTDGGWVNFLGTLAAIFAPFAIAIVLFASRYGRGTYQRKSKNRHLSFRVRPLGSTLLILEVKKYFSSPLYVFNTAFGTVMLVAGSIAILVLGPDKIMSFLAVDGDLPIQMSVMELAGVITIAFGFMAAMTITTPVTISFEGKKFWILRSLPIRSGDILAVKLAMSILLFVPIQLICSIAVALRLGLGPVETIGMALVPASLNMAVSGAGLIINILLPKMEWRTEAEIVKQSLSVLLTVFLGFGMVALTPILYLIIFSQFGGITVAAYVVTGIYLLIFAVEFLILTTTGKKLFERITA